MPLVDLSASERAIVGQCVRALADGPFIPAWELSALTGLSEQEIRDVADRWPDVDEESFVDRRAIHGAMCCLLYGPVRDHERWADYVPVSHGELEMIARKWWRRSKPTYLDHLRQLVRDPATDRSTIRPTL